VKNAFKAQRFGEKPNGNKLAGRDCRLRWIQAIKGEFLVGGYGVFWLELKVEEIFCVLIYFEFNFGRFSKLLCIFDLFWKI
jgi:hypothetical protein